MVKVVLPEEVKILAIPGHPAPRVEVEAMVKVDRGRKSLNAPTAITLHTLLALLSILSLPRRHRHYDLTFAAAATFDSVAYFPPILITIVKMISKPREGEIRAVASSLFWTGV